MDAHRTPEDQSRLAKHVARKIFEAPCDSQPDAVKRIQFRDIAERDYGGLCEEALVGVITRALRDFK